MIMEPTNPQSPLSIMVVEDHACFRELLSLLIDRTPGMKLCGTARNSLEALEMLPTASPDMVLIDISMPGLDGFCLMEKIQQYSDKIRCVILTGHSEREYTARAIACGAHGFIIKGTPSTILDGIKRVAAGEKFISPKLL